MAYPGLAEQAEKAGLKRQVENKWELVFDFSSSGTENFMQIPPEEWSPEILQIPGQEESSNEKLFYAVPSRYGGDLGDEPPQSSAMINGEHSFSIHTSAKEA